MAWSWEYVSKSLFDGLIIAVFLFLFINYIIVPRLTPTPEMELKCFALKEHNSLIAIKNIGDNPANDFNIIITNDIWEGSSLKFRDEIDNRLCSIDIIGRTTKVTLDEGGYKEVEIPKRALIKCNSFPIDKSIDLLFENWAGNFTYQFWADNLRTKQNLLKCDWTDEGLNTYCREQPDKCK